jgi:hypothetical protein
MNKPKSETFDPPVAIEDASNPAAVKTKVNCHYDIKDRVRDVLVRHNCKILSEEILGIGRLNEEKAKAGIAEYQPETYQFNLAFVEQATLNIWLDEVLLEK